MVQRIEEIRLVLVLVHALKQVVPACLLADPGVVPGGDLLGTEAAGIFQELAELDLAVTQHIRVGRTSSLVLAQENGEYPLPVLV